MKREKVGAGRGERERRESKNTVYCSKWALARSCVTTSSIAHKENAREKEREREREGGRENVRREREGSNGTEKKIDNFIVRTDRQLYCVPLRLTILGREEGRCIRIIAARACRDSAEANASNNAASRR